jgi:ABC-type glutathione transport system ATPase component
VPLGRLDPLLLLLPLAAVPPLITGRHATRTIEQAKTQTATSTRVALNLFSLSATARFAGELRVFRLGSELRRRHEELWKTLSQALLHAYARAVALRAAGQLVFSLAYDVSLALPAGSTVAIVGENGAGNNTLVKLLCGLYRPSGGRILLVGRDLLRVSTDEWRARIGAVLAALERARATDVVGQLRQGLETLPGNSRAITVLVSHRFSTVRMADLIVVLRDGRVKEFGDHDTLIKNGGLYGELCALQARANSYALSCDTSLELLLLLPAKTTVAHAERASWATVRGASKMRKCNG